MESAPLIKCLPGTAHSRTTQQPKSNDVPSADLTTVTFGDSPYSVRRPSVGSGAAVAMPDLRNAVRCFSAASSRLPALLFKIVAGCAPPRAIANRIPRRAGSANIANTTSGFHSNVGATAGRGCALSDMDECLPHNLSPVQRYFQESKSCSTRNYNLQTSSKHDGK